MLRSTRTVSAVAALATVLLMTGCAAAGTATTPSASGTAAAAPSASPSSTAIPCATSGSASDAVKVTDKGKGVEPAVSFTKGTTASTTQRTTVTTGTGTTIKQGDTVRVAYAMYDGTSGKRLDAQGYTTAASSFPVDSTLLRGITEALNCTRTGDRIAAVIPSSQAFGTQGVESLGIAPGDSLVFVADVLGLQATKADGAAKSLPSGFPTVTLAADGQPTVKIPATTAPTTLKIADSKVGTGETVRKGDTVTLQYQGVLWRTGAVFDQSWTKGGPTNLATTQVVQGFGDALVGQKVGSQVVAIIPPKYGYGDNPPSGGTITKTDTMVFVIDVLGTQHAS